MWDPFWECACWHYLSPLCFYLQSTKATTMDLGVTMTSSLMDLLPLRLSLRPSRPTSWALAQEPLRDQATTPRTTKGSRTWSRMQRRPALTQAYRVHCSPSQGTPTGADLVLPSPWPVTPVIVLPCPTKARKWERPPPGEGQNRWRSHHPRAPPPPPQAAECWPRRFRRKIEKGERKCRIAKRKENPVFLLRIFITKTEKNEQKKKK